MAERGTVAWRVDFQTLRPEALKEQTGRLELFFATGCTILIAHHPAPDAALELRIYLPASRGRSGSTRSRSRGGVRMHSG